MIVYSFGHTFQIHISFYTNFMFFPYTWYYSLSISTGKFYCSCLLIFSWVYLFNSFIFLCLTLDTIMIKNVMKGKIVPSEVTVKLLPKALTANQARGDDKIETIKKRFKVFLESSPPVISYYGEKGKVRKQGLLIRFLSQSRQSL
ncbi:hypothetical protein HN51_068760 [Arachis hypogaea]